MIQSKMHRFYQLINGPGEREFVKSMKNDKARFLADYSKHLSSKSTILHKELRGSKGALKASSSNTKTSSSVGGEVLWNTKQLIGIEQIFTVV